MSEVAPTHHSHRQEREPTDTPTTLREITDSSLTTEEITERLAQEVSSRELLRTTSHEERTRYFLNTSLAAIESLPRFRDLRDKTMTDTVQAQKIATLISEAEAQLRRIETEGTIRQLNSHLFDVYERFETTNLVRAIEHLDSRYKSTHQVEIVSAKRIILMALDSYQPE